MSRSPDVAVIGGGIIGCSAAAILAERGAAVILFEATAIGAGASGRNLGAIQHPFDAVLAPLYRASLAHYWGLAAMDDGFAVGAEPAGLLRGISTGPASAALVVDAILSGTPVPRALAADRPL